MEVNSNNESNKEGNEKSLPSLAEMVNRLEKANAEKAKLLEKEEQLIAFKLQGGVTVNIPEVKKEESPQEYRDRVLGMKK